MRKRSMGVVLGASLMVALALAGTTPPGRAATTELFFSEYVEGSANNKALEIYNGTGSAVSLVGYSVQFFFNGSTTAGLTINLTGTVANEDVFVLAQSSAAPAILAQADQTNGSGWFNGNDAITLRLGSTVVDSVGHVGFDPGAEWGAGLTSTADNTLGRKPAVMSGDSNTADSFDPTVEWDGYATDTFGGLGAHSVQAVQPNYVRPKGASPIKAALVPAYRSCTAPDRQHGPPLAHPSCSPPVQESNWLTTGTVDSNGQVTEFIGSARFATLPGDPATVADEADVAVAVNIAGVRNKADLTDYTGEVEILALVRITDRFNSAAPGGGSDPATVVSPIRLPVRATCVATADPALGGICAVSTSMDAVVTGTVKERQRAIWALDAIQVHDGGEDGIAASQPNTPFARQGVFVP